MVSINLSISEELRSQAQEAAQSEGVSLEDFIRECLSARLRSAAQDPFLGDSAVYSDPTPQDLSERHDDYLYGSES